MSWEAVARKDFQDSIRSWWLWGLSAVFTVFFTASAYLFTDAYGRRAQQQQVQLTSDNFIGILMEVTAFIIPIIAIVVAYAAIVGERESGTLKLLLSLPHSRRDVVLGKVLGRGSVVALPVLFGFLVALFVFPLTPVSLSLGNYALFALLTALLALVFVGVAVGVSAAVSTSRRAVIGTVGLYVLFTLFWNQLTNTVVQELYKQFDIAAATYVKVHLFLKVLNPTQAYKSLALRLVRDSAVAARSGLIGRGLRQRGYAQQLGDAVPVYLSDAAVLLVLLLWLAVPVVLGYWAFERADL